MAAEAAFWEYTCVNIAEVSPWAWPPRPGRAAPAWWPAFSPSCGPGSHLHSTVQYTTVHYSTVLYSTVPAWWPALSPSCGPCSHVTSPSPGTEVNLVPTLYLSPLWLYCMLCVGKHSTASLISSPYQCSVNARLCHLPVAHVLWLPLSISQVPKTSVNHDVGVHRWNLWISYLLTQGSRDWGVSQISTCRILYSGPNLRWTGFLYWTFTLNSPYMVTTNINKHNGISFLWSKFSKTVQYDQN